MRRRTKVLGLGVAVVLGALVSAQQLDAMRPSVSQPARPPGAVGAVFVGDSFTVGTGAATGESGGLGRQIADRLGWSATVSAGSSSGYVAEDRQGVAFGGRLPDVVAADPDVVVIAGSRNDVWHPVEAVREASRTFYSRIHASLPHTRIVVIGVMIAEPQVDGAPSTPAQINEALRASARAEDAVFIDPRNPNWMKDMRGRMSPDGVHPNALGYRYLSERAAPLIRQALRAERV